MKLILLVWGIITIPYGIPRAYRIALHALGSLK